MGRMTVTINEEIEKSLRKIQGRLIAKTGEEWSFTTIINMVLLGGLIGSEKFTKKHWESIYKFLEEEMADLELQAPIDKYLQNVIQQEVPELPAPEK